ncbi:integrase family protein (plasmid) [Pseudonocardia dioxanivorans CB1190]|uniref:Integrase family protein n=1 Tax=Pseudonocardia dioxanivorans (strain ATCC 55486 / DSM 44775 / JCM 13855 / CB1190) TaxID=675635 RepID=F2L6T5_PSEUX|nr:tyrosine-type recombinase/integrase [Pseudonocardia dioxanivorans]AEA28807.1 integrase family protein [Pseudonocardia dioxanivorans CB1190]GJF03549.1 integrase [Pseudonocardia sp. D17]
MSDASPRPSPALVPLPAGATPLEPVALGDGAAGYAAAARAPRTWQAYRTDFRRFQRWCTAQSPPVPALPATPATVAAYLAAHAASHRPSTLARWCSALAVAHDLAGHPSPTRDPAVRTVLAGIRRTHRARPHRVAAPGPDQLRTLLAPLDPDQPRDARDRALILIGFAGALRRSELAALTLADLVLDTDGLRVFIAASKTDPTGTGHTRGLAYGTHPDTCPVRAWQAWLHHRHPSHPSHPSQPVPDRGGHPAPAPPTPRAGSAFVGIDRWGHLATRGLSDRAIAAIISDRARAAGLPGHWAGHSLRRGFATTAYRAGTAEIALMRHGRWRSPAAMRGYIDEGTVWTDNPSRTLGL